MFNYISLDLSGLVSNSSPYANLRLNIIAKTPYINNIPEEPSNPNRIDLSYIRETIGTKTIVSTETIRHLIEFTFPTIFSSHLLCKLLL